MGQKIIQTLLEDGVITKEGIGSLIKARPPKKITLENLISENILTVEALQKFFVHKLQHGALSVADIEEVEGIDIEPFFLKLAEALHVGYIDLDDTEIDMSLFGKASYPQLVRYNVLPFDETDLGIKVVFSDPLDMGAQDAIQRLFPLKPVQVFLSRPSKIKLHLQRLEVTQSVKGLIAEIRADLREGGLEKETDESPAVLKLIDLILRNAIITRASDIHIEATEKNCVVRDRVDGMLVQSFLFDKDIFSPLSSRMKLLSNLDIAEKRKPQDGRFAHTVADREFDFRVSTLPTLFGESIVLRILDKTKVMIRLEDAGMSTFCYNRFSEAIKAPYGIVLVTGPTGSGKTTTLYGALNAIRDVRDKIITVEDPVEYQMNGIQQVNVNAHAGLSFANALRSILRQDPDKIMIGEIRDAETLRIAIQAALTGHLVLSTLHTNDAISAVTRILDMGIESYLVSGALVAIQAQRLVRKICPHCKVPATISSKVLEELGDYTTEGATYYKGEGCKECQHTGYIGREMISEVFPISDKTAHMIAAGVSKEELTRQAEEEGFVSMLQDGIKKAEEGKTTIDEIFRVARL
jgi:general secretion pathway protein E